MLEVFNCEQQSPDWAALRMGIPTASEFATVMASGKGGTESKTRDLYLRQLAGELVSEIPRETYRNKAMDRGNAMEDDIRRLYAMMADVEVSRVGFLKNGRKGASPDGLIGRDGMVEIKSEAPHLLILRYFSGAPFPAEHMAQCQGNLWVAERDWIDIAIGYGKMPLYLKRIHRDEAYIARLALAVDVFLEDLDALVAKIKAYH